MPQRRMPAVDQTDDAELEAVQALRDNPDALQRLSARGVRNFLLASDDGLLIDAVTATKTLDLDEVAASAASTLKATQAKALALGLGLIKGIIVEFTDGESVVLDPLGDEAMAVYLAESADGLRQLARELPHLAPVASAGYEFLKAGAAPAPPAAAVPAATPPVASAARPAVEQKVAPQPRVQQPPARPAAVRPPAPPATRVPAPVAPKHPAPAAGVLPRLVLCRAELEIVGFTATASVEIAIGDRHAVGRAVGRNVPDLYLALAADAAIRAITEFLPAGHAIVLENIQPVSSATEVAVWANVIFITPSEEQLLPGIARLDGQPTLSAAKSILSAVNRRLELALGHDQ